MGAYDDAQHPWLRDTKELIREAAGAGVPTLGICLGHQLCAVALGGARGPQPAWPADRPGPDRLARRSGADPLVGRLVDAHRGVQWNDDIVDRLPEDAELLAETAAGEAQVVRFAPSVWSVQRHPEADERVLAPWAADDTRRYDDDRIERGLAEVAARAPSSSPPGDPLAESLVRLVRTARCSAGRHSRRCTTRTPTGEPYALAMGKQEDFVLRALEERDVRFVRLWFTDVLGFLKSVAVAPAELEGAFSEGIGFDGSAIEGFARVYEADMLLPSPTRRPSRSCRGAARARRRRGCSATS